MDLEKIRSWTECQKLALLGAIYVVLFLVLVIASPWMVKAGWLVTLGTPSFTL